MSQKIGEYTLGNVIVEGKTKQVYDLPNNPDFCLLLSKDRITAGDGVRAHDLAGKAIISNKTNGKVFEVLNQCGLATAYVKEAAPNAFIAKKCQMIPIEWVMRRLATGSFIKRNPGVKEGYRFTPVKQETFFKDDANHDPQWSDEQILSSKFNFNGLEIGQTELTIMKKASVIVFEILEKMWASRNCALIDMKIEFGVDKNKNILLADIIDSDSWRLWPSGDKRLMVDKQVYRNLSTVTATDLDEVKRNFTWVASQLDSIIPKGEDHLVVVIMGSQTDLPFCEDIVLACKKFGLNVRVRCSSAHKSTIETLRLVQEFEGTVSQLIFIAVAGRSNGLGPVLSGNTTYPVINCPPVNNTNIQQDIWSSLNVPSGLGVPTVRYPEAAAIHAAQILALNNYMIWGRLRVSQLNQIINICSADKAISKP